jgi:hypothetical protein
LVNSVPGVPSFGCSATGKRRVQTLVYVQTFVKEVLAWQRRIHNRGRIPNKHSHDVEESKLGDRFAKLLLRRDKALSSRSQLSPSEVALVNSVPGVPLHGCSATASCSNRGDKLEAGRSKVRKTLAAGSISSSRGSRRGRKNAKNKGSTADVIKKQAASDACTQAKRQALTELPAKAGAMAATRKPSVQAAGSSTGGGSGNGSGGVHSTAVAADAKMMLLPTPIRQQSWNIQLEGSHSEMAFKRRKL